MLGLAGLLSIVRTASFQAIGASCVVTCVSLASCGIEDAQDLPVHSDAECAQLLTQRARTGGSSIKVDAAISYLTPLGPLGRRHATDLANQLTTPGEEQCANEILAVLVGMGRSGSLALARLDPGELCERERSACIEVYLRAIQRRELAVGDLSGDWKLAVGRHICTSLDAGPHPVLLDLWSSARGIRELSEFFRANAELQDELSLTAAIGPLSCSLMRNSLLIASGASQDVVDSILANSTDQELLVEGTMYAMGLGGSPTLVGEWTRRCEGLASMYERQVLVWASHRVGAGIECKTKMETAISHVASRSASHEDYKVVVGSVRREIEAHDELQRRIAINVLSIADGDWIGEVVCDGDLLLGARIDAACTVGTDTAFRSLKCLERMSGELVMSTMSQIARSAREGLGALELLSLWSDQGVFDEVDGSTNAIEATVLSLMRVDPRVVGVASLLGGMDGNFESEPVHSD